MAIILAISYYLYSWIAFLDSPWQSFLFYISEIISVEFLACFYINVSSSYFILFLIVII